MGGITDAKLQELLAELDYVSPAEIKKAADVAAAQDLSLYDAIVRSDLVSDENLGKLISFSLKLPFADLSHTSISDPILHITPESMAKSKQTVTFALDDKSLHIATADPTNTTLFELLTQKAGASQYRLFYATQHGIQEAARLYKKQLQATFEDLLKSKTGIAGEAPVAKIVDALLEYAYASKTSDVHIEPTRTAVAVRFRVDGVLHDTVRLPKPLQNQIIARIKVMARLRTDEHFSAQDGRLRFVVEGENVDVRVSIVPIVAGEKVVMRLLTSNFRQFGLTDLGMNDTDLAKVKRGFTRPYGMVLSTGPTGSGKTTSMYAIVKILNTREKNIATIEDPVEYEVEGINQIQANPKTNLTFANGLRSILRQDPDIIYVGEIRDPETADIAINSALTGHLVLSTLHTNNAATSLPRLIDMGIEPFLVASTVNAIIAQRLVRKICPHCKVSAEITREEAKTAQTDPAALKAHAKNQQLAAQLAAVPTDLVSKIFGRGRVRVYYGAGCDNCRHSGYLGRIGIFEVLEISPHIQALITAKAEADAITKQAVSEGMTTMLEDGLAKVQQGHTTLEEIIRTTRA